MTTRWSPAPCVLLLATAVFGCSSGKDGSSDGVVANTEPAAVPKIEAYRRWSDHIGQGGGPTGAEDFEALARAGYKHVLTVDGAVPDVETAKRYGLSYIHVPIGYDGVTRDEAVAIVKAVKDADGPIYVHCHHGLHRGPAAAAMARIALEGVPTDKAVKDLEASGCKYEGLFRDVNAFKPPTAEELAKVGDLPEAVVPSGMRDSMTHIDDRWDSIQFVKKLGYKPSADHPDIDPAHEVGMLENLLRNLAEQPDAKALGPEFVAMAEASRAAAANLEAKVRAGDPVAAEDAFKALKDSCSKCHKKYRD
jgi:uncharacterized protein (TIGR01244 family)